MSKCVWVVSVTCLGMAACRQAPRYREADSFYFRNQPDRVIEAYAPALEDRGPDALVGVMKLLSATLLEQDWEQAENLALEVSVAVNVFLANQPGERDALSVFGREADKPFKGEPHEQAMADFYLGVLRFVRDDHEGALACFRSALNKDRGSYLLPVKTENAERGADNVERYLYEPDYATLEFFAALCWSLLGEEGPARESHAAARKLLPAAAELFDAGMDERNNVLVLVEAGSAPRKRAGGAAGSTLIYEQGEEVRVDEVLLNGQPLPFAVTDDLYAQATTLGRRSVDELNQAKATRQRLLANIGLGTALVGAHVAVVGRHTRNARAQGAGLIILGLGLLTHIFARTAIQPQADTRAWSLLPDQLVLAVGRAPAGSDHRLEVRASGPGGPFTQKWTGVPLKEGPTLLPVRLLRSRAGGVWGQHSESKDKGTANTLTAARAGKERGP